MKEKVRRQNSTTTSRHISSASLLDVSDGIFQRALLNKLELRWGTHNRSYTVNVQGSHFVPAS
jgi:hypothetical protein